MFYVQDTVSLRGELFFPNLQFDKTTVDFGCILNDTEVTRYIHVLNTSPMAVSYQWSFVLSDQPVAVFSQPADVMDVEGVVEDVDETTTAIDSALDDTFQVDIAVEGLIESSAVIPAPSTSSEVVSSSLSVYLSVTLCPCWSL